MISEYEATKQLTTLVSMYIFNFMVILNQICVVCAMPTVK
jgi:hypothetical protein